MEGLGEVPDRQAYKAFQAFPVLFRVTKPDLQAVL